MVKLPAWCCPESAGKRHVVCSASPYGEQGLAEGHWKAAGPGNEHQHVGGDVCAQPEHLGLPWRWQTPLPSTGWMFCLVTSQGWTLWSQPGKLLRSFIIPVWVSGPWVRVQGLAACRWKGTCPGNLAKPQDFALKQLPKAHTLCSILSLVGYSAWQAGGNKQLEELAASALLSEHVSEPWIHLSIKPLIGKCNPENYISEWVPVRNRWTCRYGLEWN